jgi:hypothetical protein
VADFNLEISLDGEASAWRERSRMAQFSRCGTMTNDKTAPIATFCYLTSCTDGCSQINARHRRLMRSGGFTESD